MSASPSDSPGPRAIVARGRGVTGGELVLRRSGQHFEIIDNGVFLMDTRNGESERAMVRAALEAAAGKERLSVLIGGLGVGFSARAGLADPRVERVCVVELEPRIIEWHRGYLADRTGGLFADPRVEVVCDDLVRWLARHPGGSEFDAVCLDIDNGPEWTVIESNARLYEQASLEVLDRLLRPGAAMTFWSAARADAFERMLLRRYEEVGVLEFPVPRGDPDVVYLVRPDPT